MKMKLTDRAIVNLKATGKAHKHFDGGGLYIFVTPVGGKSWRMTYRIAGKPKVLTIGSYPAISLKRAREHRDKVKTLLAEGIDPRVYQTDMKKFSMGEDTFEAIAREWHIKFKHTWSEEHGGKILARLEKDIFPKVGGLPITDVKAQVLLEALENIVSRGALETAQRTLQTCSKIFRYAISFGKTDANVAANLSGALPPPQKRHYPTITDPLEVGKLLRVIENYQGQYIVTCALKLAPLVFLRPGELRKGEWNEVNFEQAEWRIPAERMKMKEQHIVPLATQTLALLV